MADNNAGSTTYTTTTATTTAAGQTAASVVAQALPQQPAAKSDDAEHWKAEARKWEQRATDNKKELDALKAGNAGGQDFEARLKEVSDQLAQMQRERDELRHQSDLRTWADEVSAAKHVPASVLRGSTKEEMEAHADAILGSGLSFGAVPDGGEAKPTPVTREQIDAIKDPHKRLMATAQNLDLYR